MSENERRKEELIGRLDNLEACKDNPVYLAEIKEIRKDLADLWVEFIQKLKIGGCQDERKEP